MLLLLLVLVHLLLRVTGRRLYRHRPCTKRPWHLVVCMHHHHDVHLS